MTAILTAIRAHYPSILAVCSIFAPLFVMPWLEARARFPYRKARA